MGYITVLGDCVRCHRLMSFSPTKVPSVLVAGRRQPLCEDCVGVINVLRVERALEPITILPGAYEGDPEEEVPY